MSDKTLGKARGLNSIANPRDFKGAAGRRRNAPSADVPPPPPAPDERPAGEEQAPAPADDNPKVETPTPEPAAARDRASSAAPPVRERPTGPKRATSATADTARKPATTPAAAATSTERPAPATPHRAVSPGSNRKRRELSVPHPVAEAVERTGINPADVVMAGYRKHADPIYAGAGGRMVARGRTRLRLSISDNEFEQLTRLGQARGWNRSETVSVILALELLGPEAGGVPSTESA